MAMRYDDIMLLTSFRPPALRVLQRPKRFSADGKFGGQIRQRVFLAVRPARLGSCCASCGRVSCAIRGIYIYLFFIIFSSGLFIHGSLGCSLVLLRLRAAPES